MDRLFFILIARFFRLNLVKEKILMELSLDLYLFNILTVTEEGQKDLLSGPQYLSLKTTQT